MKTLAPSDGEEPAGSEDGRDAAEMLVREYVAFVLRAKDRFGEGLADASDPLKTIESEARRLGHIVLGRDPAFGRQHWQNVSRLGANLKVLLPSETKHYGDPGCALFMWLANQALKASVALDEGMGEDEVQRRLEAVVDDVVARIVGVR